MSDNVEKTKHPEVIFDSRVAKGTYADYSYYRSSSFKVPAGYVALVEVTAHKDHLPNITFSAIRVPESLSSEQCFKKTGIGKYYRRWKCYQGLGSHQASTPPTAFTDYNKSIVLWGWDNFNDKLVEFDYVTRPGEYYLVADKANNPALEDCDSPTIIEMTLLKTHTVYDLELPCCDPCDESEAPAVIP